jgi:membrane protein YqaA with SNARE-associated domain
MIAALAVVALWALAEAILFFVVADVPISYVALRYGWQRALHAALLAAAMAGLGGVLLLLWTRVDAGTVRNLIVALPAIDPKMLRDAALAFADGGYWAMAKGSFSGIPYKLYAYAASPSPPGGLGGFLLASILARLPRFLLITALVSVIGRWLAPRTPLRGRMTLLAGCWLLFYGWYFAIMPG